MVIGKYGGKTNIRKYFQNTTYYVIFLPNTNNSKIVAYKLFDNKHNLHLMIGISSHCSRADNRISIHRTFLDYLNIRLHYGTRFGNMH